MTTPPSPPLPPTSPLHRALRAAAKPPRRRTRRQNISPSIKPRSSSPTQDPSVSTAAVSGSPPATTSNPSSQRAPFFKSSREIRTRLRNIRGNYPERPRRRRDDLFQTLLSFPEHDAATVTALLHHYEGDYDRVKEKLAQFRTGNLNPASTDVVEKLPEARKHHETREAPQLRPPSSGMPEPALFGNGDQSSIYPPDADASSPASMRSLHMGASVAAAGPNIGRSPGVGNLFDRPSEGLGREVREGTGKGSRKEMSPRAWSMPEGSEEEQGAIGTLFENGRTRGFEEKGRAFHGQSVPPLSLGKGGKIRRREWRSSHPPVAGRGKGFGMGSDGSSVESFGMGGPLWGARNFVGGGSVGGGMGKLSGVKRQRSTLGSADVTDEGEAGGSVLQSPQSWRSSGEMRAIGDGRMLPFIGFRRTRSGLEAGVGHREPSEEEEVVGHLRRDGSEMQLRSNWRGGEGSMMRIEVEGYRTLLKKVERLEEEVRKFRQQSGEMRTKMQKQVENVQLEQIALERRHEALGLELDENHRRGVNTERYLDTMRRDLLHAIGRRQSRVSVILRSTVNNGVYYILAYLVPVFAFMIRGLRDGYVAIRRRVRKWRGQEEGESEEF